MDEAVRTTRRALSRVAGEPAVRNFLRSGFIARGAVYAVVAALALALALGFHEGATTDTRGALAALATGTIGRALLVALGVALAGLAAFFALEAILPSGGTNRLWRAAMRIGNAGGAVGYGLLAFAAERLGLGERPEPDTSRVAKAFTQRALELPGGRWLVLAIALVILFVGGRQAWRGLRRAFLEDLPLQRVPRPLRGWATPLGVVGFFVQGTVLVLVGGFFLVAAVRDRAAPATGFDGALAAIAAQRWGSALLGLVALGLFAYAAYSLVEGHYRRLRS